MRINRTGGYTSHTRAWCVSARCTSAPHTTWLTVDRGTSEEETVYRAHYKRRQLLSGGFYSEFTPDHLHPVLFYEEIVTGGKKQKLKAKRKHEKLLATAALEKLASL